MLNNAVNASMQYVQNNNSKLTCINWETYYSLVPANYAAVLQTLDTLTGTALPWGTFTPILVSLRVLVFETWARTRRMDRRSDKTHNAACLGGCRIKSFQKQTHTRTLTCTVA